MKVLVDMSLCMSNAQCMAAAPEVFDLHEDGELEVLDENPPAALRPKLERAILLCPTQAISMHD